MTRKCRDYVISFLQSSMAKKKKVNPRNKPLSQADVPKIRDEAIHLSFALFLTILKENFGFDQDQITFVWERADKLSKEAAEGRISIRDLADVLREEYNLDLE